VSEAFDKYPPLVSKRTRPFAFAWGRIKRHKTIYLLFIPLLLQFIIFRYFTLYGLKAAFLDFKLSEGLRSPWIGLTNFKIIFQSHFFFQLLRNTIVITGMRILIGFPVPVILALLLNEIRMSSYKRVCQTVLYLPHFFTWVVLYGMFVAVFNDRNGLLPRFLGGLGASSYMDITRQASTIRIWLVISGVWKGMGWGTIIYLAAISGVDPQLYESAVMDGANRLRQTWHITMPAIFPIVAISFVFNLERILREDFQQILVFTKTSALLYEKTMVFETWIFHQGIERGIHDLATAMGLFQIAIGLLLALSANRIAAKMGYEVLW
jgi:putative aldouronate transport system permease protein